MLEKAKRNIFIHQGFRSISELEGEKNKQKVQDKIKILENDLTKALINTIIYSEPARNVFVKMLKNNKIKIKESDIKEENIDLQFGGKLDKNPQSVLILITLKYKKCNIDLNNMKRVKNTGTVLDALISVGNKNIGIESKLTEKIDPNQLKREMNLLGTEKKIDLFWEDIHTEMKKELKNNSKDIILKNFVELLEVADMTEFTDINPSEYFNRGKVKEIYKQILIKIKRDKNLKLTGELKSNWINLYEKSDKDKGIHYSLSINTDFLRIELVIPSKKIKKETINENKFVDCLKKIIKNKNAAGKWYFVIESYKCLNRIGKGPQKMKNVYPAIINKINLNDFISDINFLKEYIKNCFSLIKKIKQIEITIELYFADKKINKVDFKLIKKQILILKPIYLELKKIFN